MASRVIVRIRGRTRIRICIVMRNRIQIRIRISIVVAVGMCYVYTFGTSVVRCARLSTCTASCDMFDTFTINICIAAFGESHDYEYHPSYS